MLMVKCVLVFYIVKNTYVRTCVIFKTIFEIIIKINPVVFEYLRYKYLPI